MKADTLLKTIFIFLLFLLLTAVISLPFFVVFKEATKDYIAFSMLVSALIILVFIIKKNSVRVDFYLKFNKVTLITLALILLSLTVYFLIIPLDKDSIVTVEKENWLLLISAIIIGPLAEEIIFRQILFKQLFDAKGFWFAALFTSIVFAVMHIQFIQMLSAFFTSLILSYNFYKKESLLEAYMLHGLKNFIAIIFPYFFLS